MFAPSGIPKPVLNTIGAALKASLSDPQSVERLTAIGVEASFKDSDAFPELYWADVQRWREFAQKYGFKIGN